MHIANIKDFLLGHLNLNSVYSNSLTDRKCKFKKIMLKLKLNNQELVYETRLSQICIFIFFSL